MLLRRVRRMLVAALAVPLLAAMTSEASPASRAAAEPTLLAYQALTGGIFTIQPSGLGNREVIPGALTVWHHAPYRPSRHAAKFALITCVRL